jgi:NAD(P)-dependent dehydrogenase (short-subunit alcohol dehydrogenase family)
VPGASEKQKQAGFEQERIRPARRRLLLWTHIPTTEETDMGVIVITGGSRGIGASAAEHIARKGLGVILTYNANPQAAASVVDRIEQAGGKAVALKLDVSNVGGFSAFRESVVVALREIWSATSLSGLVNNAGYGLFNPLATVSEAQFDDLFNVHLKGPFFLTQALLPLLAEGASIVNLTSATTRVATAGVAPYAAFKGGLEVLTRYMAKEFGERRIRANAVSPGAIRTELGGGLNDEFEAMLAAQTALARVGEPEDVARVIAMLLSEEGAWINAQTIEVAGGYNI